MNISRTNGNLSPSSNFFRSLPLSTYCTLYGPRLICGHLLWVTGMRMPDGEYVIVVSGSQSEEVMDKYKRRWKIEIYQSCNLRRTLFWQKIDFFNLSMAQNAVLA